MSDTSWGRDGRLQQGWAAEWATTVICKCVEREIQVRSGLLAEVIRTRLVRSGGGPLLGRWTAPGNPCRHSPPQMPIAQPITHYRARFEALTGYHLHKPPAQVDRQYPSPFLPLTTHHSPLAVVSYHHTLFFLPRTACTWQYAGESGGLREIESPKSRSRKGAQGPR